MKLSAEAPQRREAESVAHVTMQSIHPLKVQVFKLRPRRILPLVQPFGLLPCLHGTMHKNFLLSFSDRFRNFTEVAPVHPEINHAQVSDESGNTKGPWGKKTHTTSKACATCLSGPAYDGAEKGFRESTSPILFSTGRRSNW